MKHIRVELKLTAIVHVGEDVPGDGERVGTREPDAIQFVELARVNSLPSCGGILKGFDVAGNTLAAILSDAAPVIGSRLNHALRKKGL